MLENLLRDRYPIQSLLGRKTRRRTFLANDLETRSPVVIKLLLFGPDFTWDDLKLFEREAETLKSLDHAAIPKYLVFFEVDTKSGKGFALVQSYIEARSLQDWVQSGRAFSEAEIKAIATELLTILDYLHTRQPPVIHRDIKPSNVLLGVGEACAKRTRNSLGQVYLVDFGSVQTAQQGGTITVVGTYGYMPPEQFGGKTSHASDLYSTGATLIYLATGQHPNELPQKEMRILFDNQVNLKPALIDWLHWLTEPSLELRLPSAKQALAALEKPRESALTIARKPIGSKVQVTNTRQKLEILIPPPRRRLFVGIMTIGFAIIAWKPLMKLVMFWYDISLITWDDGGETFALVGSICLGLGLWGLWGLWRFFFTLSRQMRLRITYHEISLAHELFGIRCLPARTATRQEITSIEFVRLVYFRDNGESCPTFQPEINIWAGTKKFELSNGCYLKAPELDWLAQTLSSWLNLPITHYPSPKTRKNNADHDNLRPCTSQETGFLAKINVLKP